MNKTELIEVFTDTKERLDGFASISSTEKWTVKKASDENFGSAYTIKSGNVSIAPLDTISTALSFIKGKTCILNMASYRRPGGGVENGSRAQEESLFRSTDLYKTVTPKYYPLMDNEALYTENSIIIKDKDYELLDTPMFVDCITIAALNINKGKPENYRDIMKAKIELMFDLATLHKIDNLVLGAWGCGVFGNDPKDVSNMFKYVLKGYLRNFETVVFGVINDHNSVDNNFEVFRKCF